MLIRVNCSSLIILQDSASLPTQKAPSCCPWKSSSWSSATCTSAGSGSALTGSWADPKVCWASAHGVPLLQPSPAAGGEQQWGWAGEEAGGGSQPQQCQANVRRAGSQEKHCLLLSFGTGWRQGKEKEKRDKTKSTRTRNTWAFSSWTLIPGLTSPFLDQTPSYQFATWQACASGLKSLLKNILQDILQNILSLHLTAFTSLINTQLKWKLFLLPPLLFINRKGDKFWTITSFQNEQKYI